MYAIRSYYAERQHAHDEVDAEGIAAGPDQRGADGRAGYHRQSHRENLRRAGLARNHVIRIERYVTRSAGHARITSYNVCYTKLLRRCPVNPPFPSVSVCAAIC